MVARMIGVLECLTVVLGMIENVDPSFLSGLVNDDLANSGVCLAFVRFKAAAWFFDQKHRIALWSFHPYLLPLVLFQDAYESDFGTARSFHCQCSQRRSDPRQTQW